MKEGTLLSEHPRGPRLLATALSSVLARPTAGSAMACFQAELGARI